MAYYLIKVGEPSVHEYLNKDDLLNTFGELLPVGLEGERLFMNPENFKGGEIWHTDCSYIIIKGEIVVPKPTIHSRTIVEFDIE